MRLCFSSRWRFQRPCAAQASGTPIAVCLGFAEALCFLSALDLLLISLLSSMELVGDGDARISYRGNWSVQNVTGADQGSVHTSTDPAGVISLTFVGSSIEIDAVKSPMGVNFTVVLDTSTYGPYSLYSPTTTVGNVWSQTQLNPTTTHMIALQKVQASAGPDSTLALNVDVFRIASDLSSLSSSSSSTTVSSSSTGSTSQSTSTSSLQQEPISSSLIITNSYPPSSVLTSSSNQCSAPSFFVPEIQPTYNLPPPDTEPSPSPDDTYTADVSDDSIPQPASPPTSTTSSRWSTTVSRNSTSSSSTRSRSATSIAAFSIPQTPSTSATVAAVDASSNTSGPDNRTSILLGTIVGAVIFLCLITIPIVYIKRKREENLAQELKASTTPAYQTRTAKGLLMPLGIYRRPTSTTSTTSPNSINYRWGFGTQRHYDKQSASPSATSPSPRGAAGGRRTSFEDAERSHYLIYPDAAPGSEPVEFRGHGRTDSISSDYPYPVIYHP